MCRFIAFGCLSISYFNNYSDLLWKCDKGHIWHATFHAIKNHNTWCPICRNKYENLCREIISKYLGPPQGLELDIYYPEHGFAIEVQGIALTLEDFCIK
ncbi:hypothetical protein RhiirC2_784453 [Rhizophagus irregularis]|uniref:Uncharacterized protein n=1 Tax=Rhizophagus irregularis TaxID=588596 RepID=A0A2N1MYG6_9GLOM|nr:hypothetical protein RhiirC2_784453 [Rhizophagus irregularis]